MSYNPKPTLLQTLPCLESYHYAAKAARQEKIDLQELADRLGFLNVDEAEREISIDGECEILFVRVDRDGDKTVFQAGERTFCPRVEVLSPWLPSAEQALTELNRLLAEQEAAREAQKKADREARKTGRRK